MCKILPFLSAELERPEKLTEASSERILHVAFSCLLVDYDSCLFADLVDFSTIFRKTMLCYTPNRKRKEYTP